MLYHLTLCEHVHDPVLIRVPRDIGEIVVSTPDFGYRQPPGLRRWVGQVEAHARAAALLADAVQKQAYVLAYIDGFTILGFAVIVALVLMLLLRSPPEQSILKSLLNSAASPSTVRDNQKR